jgi:hypothetical protein
MVSLLQVIIMLLNLFIILQVMVTRLNLLTILPVVIIHLLDIIDNLAHISIMPIIIPTTTITITTDMEMGMGMEIETEAEEIILTIINKKDRFKAGLFCLNNE